MKLGKFKLKDGTIVRGVRVQRGWLDYTLREGNTLVVGLARPGTWEEYKPKIRK
jgi:hypothetical protein